MATSVKYISDKSEETYDNFSKSGEALYSFPKAPITMKRVYDKVQNVHPFTLCLTKLQTGVASRQFRVDMLALLGTEKCEDPLYQTIISAQDSRRKIFENICLVERFW